MSYRSIAWITARRGAAALAVASLMPLATAGVSAAAASTGTAGTISTIAGGVGGPAKATSVAIGGPYGVTLGNGKLYFADVSTVRELNPASDYMTTPAGSGANGPMGANGSSAVRASMNTGVVAVDHSGNLVIGDSGHNRVRVAAAANGTLYGMTMKRGHIYTVAGDGSPGLAGDGGPATKAQLTGVGGIAVDAAGNLVICQAF